MKGYTAVKSTATEPLNRLLRETRTDYQGTLIASVKMAEMQFRCFQDSELPPLLVPKQSEGKSCLSLFLGAGRQTNIRGAYTNLYGGGAETLLVTDEVSLSEKNGIEW
ncbi:hypothetical protein B0H13DRAFT_1868345 [Mycena leptocephala]|nr:hypothetical protein B0H13DRAFT_1868345 [Mycena leptocephala]